MKDLHLENNAVLGNVSEFKNFYSMINVYQDVFTNDHCHADNTTWDTFNIELLPGEKLVKQKVRPLAPLHDKILRFQSEDWIRDQVIEPSTSTRASPPQETILRKIRGIFPGNSWKFLGISYRKIR